MVVRSLYNLLKGLGPLSFTIGVFSSTINIITDAQLNEKKAAKDALSLTRKLAPVSAWNYCDFMGDGSG